MDGACQSVLCSEMTTTLHVEFGIFAGFAVGWTLWGTSFAQGLAHPGAARAVKVNIIIMRACMRALRKAAWSILYTICVPEGSLALHAISPVIEFFSEQESCSPFCGLFLRWDGWLLGLGFWVWREFGLHAALPKP